LILPRGAALVPLNAVLRKESDRESQRKISSMQQKYQPQPPISNREKLQQKIEQQVRTPQPPKTSRMKTRSLSVQEHDCEWNKRNLTCLSTHATSATELHGSLLLNWRQATENALQRREMEQRRERRSILLQPRRPYQPQLAQQQCAALEMEHEVVEMIIN